MRRKEQEITDRRELEEVIDAARVCRLAMCDDKEPYIVPVNFGYREGTFYIHGAKTGKKMSLLAKNPHVCIEIDIEGALEPDLQGNPCSYGFSYRSLIARGTARFLEDPDEKIGALGIIVKKYDPEVSRDFPEASLSRTAVIAVAVREMTGKRSS